MPTPEQQYQAIMKRQTKLEEKIDTLQETVDVLLAILTKDQKEEVKK